MGVRTRCNKLKNIEISVHGKESRRSLDLVPPSPPLPEVPLLSHHRGVDPIAGSVVVAVPVVVAAGLAVSREPSAATGGGGCGVAVRRTAVLFVREAYGEGGNELEDDGGEDEPEGVGVGHGVPKGRQTMVGSDEKAQIDLQKITRN